ERLRQGRADHLGGAGRRLPLDRARHARLRAARMPPRRVVLLVHVLAAAREVPVRARLAARALPRGPRAARRPGPPVARARRGPGEGWAELVEDPAKSTIYKSHRGRGGFVRASWQDAVELIAAAHVYTVKRYGPDRVAGFTPIPAMSMASYASGSRFMALIGGV